MARVRPTFWKKQIDKLVQSENIPVVFKQYINFGTDGGDTGYGFRDNAGTIQFKNSAGVWTDVGTGGSGSGSGDVVGPSSAVDGTPAVFDGITGKLIKNITYSAFKTLLSLTKGDVGLGNVDNVSDLNKPVSTAQQTALDLKLNTSLKGTANGLAELDAGGLVPSSQLPSYVDDVIEFADFASLPGTGETGKVYITIDNGKTFRWSGTVYAPIGNDLALGETPSTAYRGDRGKEAYDHSQITTGNPHGTTAIQTPFDDTGLSITGGQTEVQGAIGALDAAVEQHTIDIGGINSDLGTVTTKVNTVIEDAADLASFPAVGYSTAFFRALDTGIIYTWNGTSYDPIGTTSGSGVSEELAIAYAVAL